jgi:lysophospholipase L1-like esterase
MADATLPRPRTGRVRRILLILVLDLVGLVLLFGAAELLVRYRVEAGFGAAWSSLFGGAVPLAREGDSDWLEPHPTLGYRLNTSHPTVNSMGIRHTELGPEREPGTFRLLVLGDSVSWEQDGWVAMLAEFLGTPGLEVINAAIPGYTTHQERLLFETELARARPDLVLLQYCLNDNHRFLHELTDDGRWLVRQDARQVLVPTGGGFVDALSRSSYLVYELRKQVYLSRERDSGFFPWDANPDFAPAWQDAGWADQSDELERVRDVASDIGARFALVIVPYGSQLGAKYLERDREYTLTPQRRLESICTRLHVPCLDAYDAFFAQREQKIFKDGDPVHLTPLGHRLLARTVAAFLEKTHLVP